MTMSIASDIIGTHFRYPDYYLVGREKIREYAMAIQSDDPLHFSEEAAKAAGYPNVVAPLTFIAIPGRQVQSPRCAPRSPTRTASPWSQRW